MSSKYPRLNSNSVKVLAFLASVGHACTYKKVTEKTGIKVLTDLVGMRDKAKREAWGRNGTQPYHTLQDWKGAIAADSSLPVDASLVSLGYVEQSASGQYTIKITSEGRKALTATQKAIAAEKESEKAS